MATLDILTARLAEAEAAYHRLMTGSAEESLGIGDMQVRYTRANADALAAYINQLKSDIAALGGTGTGARRRAMVVTL